MKLLSHNDFIILLLAISTMLMLSRIVAELGKKLKLPIVLRQGKVAIWTGIMSMIFPFIIGFFAAYYFPAFFGNNTDTRQPLLFPLFLGTALAISALPVIARILMDMNLFKTNVGMVI